MEKQNAKYAFSIEKELELSLKLLKNEKVKTKLRGVIYKSIYCLPAMIALTNKRIILLGHKPIGADYLLYFDLKEINSIECIDDGAEISFEYSQGKIRFCITSSKGLQRALFGISNKFSSKKETENFCKLLEKTIGE